MMQLGPLPSLGADPGFTFGPEPDFLLVSPSSSPRQAAPPVAAAGWSAAGDAEPPQKPESADEGTETETSEEAPWAVEEVPLAREGPAAADAAAPLTPEEAFEEAPSAVEEEPPAREDQAVADAAAPLTAEEPPAPDGQAGAEEPLASEEPRVSEEPPAGDGPAAAEEEDAPISDATLSPRDLPNYSFSDEEDEPNYPFAKGEAGDDYLDELEQATAEDDLSDDMQLQEDWPPPPPVALPVRPNARRPPASAQLPPAPKAEPEPAAPPAALAAPAVETNAEEEAEPEPAAPPAAPAAPAVETKAEEEDTGSRVCPICFDLLEPAEGQSFCGVHLYCAECARRSARAELRRGRVPRCPDCQKEVEPVAAQQLLDFEDLESYHRLALWSNDGVTVCPKCQEGLYADAGADAGARCGTASCPACSHEFCVECRGPAHPSIADCDEAAQQRLGNRAARRRRPATDDVKLGSDEPFPCSVSAAAVPPTPTGSSMVAAGSSLSSAAMDTVGLLGALGFKRCPRCRAPVEKLDEESCDHMTCARCRHEFCWSCLADRVAIYAHGNHFHRPRCRFYSAYSGPREYIPDRCRRCAHRGAACVPPSSVAIDSTAIAPASQAGSLDAWLRSLVELLTLRSCQMLPR